MSKTHTVVAWVLVLIVGIVFAYVFFQPVKKQQEYKPIVKPTISAPCNSKDCEKGA